MNNYTIRQASAKTGISPRTIEHNIKIGALKTTLAMDGQRKIHQISEKDLQAWLDWRQNRTTFAKPSPPGWLTTTEAALALDVKPNTVRYHMFNGRLEYKVEGDRYLLKEESVQSLAQQLEASPRLLENERNRPQGTVTAQDAATALGIPRLRIYQLAKSGNIDPVYVGRNLYIKEEDVEKMKEMYAGESQAPSEEEMQRLMSVVDVSDRYLTINEAADYVDVSPQKFRYLVRSGYMKPRLKKIADYPDFKNTEKGDLIREMLNIYGPLFAPGELDTIRAMRQAYPDEDQWAQAVRKRMRITV